MPIETRGAHPHEYPTIRSLIDAAFHGKENGLYDHLMQNDQSITPDAIRVALKDSEPVACTFVLPRQIRTRQGWVPGAVITLVACRPDLQGQGYGGATVKDALAWMTTRGLAVAILVGHATYYPRFGFVPVMRQAETLVPSAPQDSARLTPATDADLPWMTALFTDQPGACPCAVARTAEPWLWAIRNPDKFALLTLPDHTGYAFVQVGERLHVQEAAAATPEAACRLLSGLQAEGAARGLAQVRLLVPPASPVAAAARAAGAETTEKPAPWGMACITDPTAFPEGIQGLVGDEFPRWSLAPFWDA